MKKYIKPAQKDAKSTESKTVDKGPKSTNGAADKDTKSTESASCKLSSLFFDPQIRDSGKIFTVVFHLGNLNNHYFFS